MRGGGRTPVFCDIERDSLNLDPADAAARVTARTKAIVAVAPLRPPGRDRTASPRAIPIIEDAAQAFGALGAGRSGAWPTFSFFPTKNLPGLGDGGLVATDDAALADRVRLLRFHGSRDKQTFEAVGYNSRLDELQAAALRLFLTRLDGWNAARREAAARYAELGLGEACELPVDEPGHVYHLYVVRTHERERSATALGRGRDRLRRVLPDAAPSAARLQPGSAMRRARFPRPSAAARRTSRSRSGRASRPDQQEQVVERVLAATAVGADAMKFISRYRIWQVVVDAGLLAAAWYLAFWLRFDTRHPGLLRAAHGESFAIVIPLGLAVFALFGLYSHWWRYVSIKDMWAVVRGVTVACIVAELAIWLDQPGARHPRAALGGRSRLADPARARRGRPPARANAHRAARAPQDRRQRAGGADRRCRRRRAS